MRVSRRGEVDPFIVMDGIKAAQAAEARGRSIIHMEVGQPGTAAPAAARAALAEAMEGEPLRKYTSPDWALVRSTALVPFSALALVVCRVKVLLEAAFT